ncbi:MAG: glycosyltransferase [Gloeocapsa sp. UFS-A4-WI-NPMV-4B04]|jgi:glycosyltransferase involved in cell wall biosynthesis|nr:glycosyltransferase [Gloeocapsa sp. UFS-A4-WI-NPMV-4B04]
MKNTTNDTLSLWREEGRHLIQENFEVFRSLVLQAKEFAQRGNYHTSAAYADLASAYAFRQHCGLFVSSELEQLLLMIGRKTIQGSFYFSNSTLLPRKPKNVLHVATAVWSIGGHSNMIWRWIQQDTERSHSVVLTRQAPMEVPTNLRDAVLNSHGKVYVLNETIGSIISWAKRLRKIATTTDIVVLHTMDDVIPIIAFANKEQCPPIIFVNHADERFWLGASITNVVANLRNSGMRLSQERRGFDVERNLLIPTVLNPTHRVLSRAEAKQKLGLHENNVLLLSIARSVKYRTIDGINFADAHVPLLKQHEQAFLLIIGPDNSEDWSSAIQETQGRIKVFGQTENTAIFFQAADIYVDSFPWVSVTSLLEAGSYGIPLVTRFPYSDTCGILGADAPGLADNLVSVRDLEEYTAVLSRLVKDGQLRLSLGEITRKKITEIHTSSNLQRSLEDLYSHALMATRLIESLDPIDQQFLGEPDVLLPHIFRHAFTHEQVDLNDIIQARVSLMPFEQRLRFWIRLLKKRDLGKRGRLSVLFPWLSLRLQKL